MSKLHDDDHDRGLAFDLSAMTARRQFLHYAGLAAAGGALAGCWGSSEANTIAKAADGSTCIADPGETAGPFPADGTNAMAGRTVNVLDQTGVERADLRTSFAGFSGDATGAALDVEITLVNVANACAPLADHVIYLWHCDAGGKYSIYDLADRNYLRGTGTTDAEGKLRFTTIFPGCYRGRWPHMHFEVFANREAAATGKNSILISQFALPLAPAQALYATNPAYRESIGNLAGQEINGDNVFGDNTPEQIVAQTLTISGNDKAGYKASATIGISINS